MTFAASRPLGLLLAASVMAGATATGHAADMLNQEAMPDTRTAVEFGTGWYIRGEVSLNDAGTLLESEVSAPVPGTTNQRSEEADVTGVFGATAAIGLRLTRNLRMDASYSYMGAGERETRTVGEVFRAPCSPAEQNTFLRNPDGTLTLNAQGDPTPVINTNHRILNCVEEDTSSYSMQNFAINGFYDFNTTILGARPFVGVGVGVIRNSFTSVTGSVVCTPADQERCVPTDGTAAPEFGEQVTQEGTRSNGVAYHLAPSVTAGLSFPINEQLHIDTSYQWTHMFEDAMWGGNSAVKAAGFPTDFHAVKIGLRMDIY